MNIEYRYDDIINIHTTRLYDKETLVCDDRKRRLTMQADIFADNRMTHPIIINRRLS